jgi:signal transduction histidine kinase
VDDRPRIMICDDSPAYRRVIQGMLGGGYDFFLAESGEEALAKIHEFSPDLVISDLIMKSVDGYEVCRRVKAELRHVPVVIMTSKTDDEAKATGLEVGADDYLFKPVRQRELCARVESLLRLRRATIALEERSRELEEANRHLRLAQDELVRTEKLASLGHLVAGIAHEINNALNYIYGNINFMTEYANALVGLVDRVPQLPGFGEEQRAAWSGWAQEADVEYIKKDVGKLMEGISAGAERAAEIVRGLRLFARGGSGVASGPPGEGEEVDLPRLIDVTLTILRHELKDRVHVTRDFGGVQAVRGDGSRLGQALMNVILNASQAIEQQGGTGRIAIRLAREGEHVICAVRDDGCGMTPEVKARAFDPFFTTKPVGRGTGLGLSIAYGIVEQHGGRIEIDSEPGKGTEVRFVLPA